MKSLDKNKHENKDPDLFLGTASNFMNVNSLLGKFRTRDSSSKNYSVFKTLRQGKLMMTSSAAIYLRML